MERIASVLAVRSHTADVVGVIVQQDSDAPNDHNFETLQSALTKSITACAAHPVVPVQELEAWWYLYPDSFRAVNPGAWRQVKLPTKQNVETIHSPKEDLIRRTRLAAPKRPYTEADSLAVAQKMATAIGEGKAPENTSKSWDRFVETARAL